MAFLSRRGAATAGLATVLAGACTPARGPLYVLATDAGVASALPVVVDDNFVASGYTGDFNGIKETSSANDSAACSPARASANAAGKCHHWTWLFSNGVCGVPGNTQAACHWACVAWLKPDNLYTDPSNPGPAAGLPMAPGATKVSFWAWAPTDRAIRFSVGDKASSEAFYASADADLTPTPMRFTIDLSGVHYNVVNTGFRWCTNDARFDSFDFYVDDIQWTAN